MSSALEVSSEPSLAPDHGRLVPDHTGAAVSHADRVSACRDGGHRRQRAPRGRERGRDQDTGRVVDLDAQEAGIGRFHQRDQQERSGRDRQGVTGRLTAVRRTGPRALALPGGLAVELVPDVVVVVVVIVVVPFAVVVVVVVVVVPFTVVVVVVVLVVPIAVVVEVIVVVVVLAVVVIVV